MTKATFICADGARRDGDVAIGTNLMRAACDHGIVVRIANPQV